MRFNAEIRKARDANTALRKRRIALRSAVGEFTPSTFDSTFSNLAAAVGVANADSWTAEEIIDAAELLVASRERYLRHRRTWDEDRRARKAEGLRSPNDADLDAFGDRSWFDHISAGEHARPRYRWVGLDGWIQLNGLTPGPFGSELTGVSQELLNQLPGARVDPARRMLAHYGPFPDFFEPANVIEIPYRIYNDPIPDSAYRSMSYRQRAIADCWYTRSCDGYTRQRHLLQVLPLEEFWVVPYVVAALGDYVIEIVHDVAVGLNRLCQPDSWHSAAYLDFAANNTDFIDLVRQRAISYRYRYHTASYSRDGVHRPRYPAFPVLDSLVAASRYPALFRVPAT